MKEINAQIESTKLGFEDHGIFTCMLYLAFEGAMQGFVWYGEVRRRVVVPQLALKTSDSGTLESSALGHFCPHCKKEIKVTLEA